MAIVGAALLLGACGAATPSSPSASSPIASSSQPIARTSPPGSTHLTTGPSTASVVVHPAAARPRPARTPCDGNALAKYVFVSLARQHLWMCARHAVAYSTPITSGMSGQYTETPTGTFVIQGRDRDTVLTLADGQQYDVKYWIPFQGPLFGFHDAPWQRFPFGGAQYRTDGSHGCVHMPLPAIAFLYGWAPVGTPVSIAA